MKKIKDTDDLVIGKYYACYRKGASFKKFSLYKYDGIFSEIVYTETNQYEFGSVENSNRVEVTPFDEVNTFELTNSEILKHVVLEDFTENV